MSNQLLARRSEPRTTDYRPVRLRPIQDAASTRAVRSANRVGTDQLAVVKAQLSPRDLDLLDVLLTYRFLTTRQLEHWLFWQHASAASRARTARRTTARLADLGLIRCLDRRIGGFAAGSEQRVWYVTESGHRLIRLGAANEGPARRRTRFHLPSTRLLDHTLAIVDTALKLRQIGRQHVDILNVEIQAEPASWRRYQGPAGVQLIRPDLAALLIGCSWEDRWFIEIDQGGMHLPTILERCQQYQAYRASGREQASREVFPMVVWVMHTAGRAAELTAAVNESTAVDARLFRVTTMDTLAEVITRGAE